MPSVTNALEELAAANSGQIMPMAGYSIMLVTTSLAIYSMGAISVMMEIRIVCHACKLASVSGAQAFESEDDLLSYYVSLNRTWQHTCAVVFEDGDVHDLKYKIRISNTWFSTAQLFSPLSWLGYKGNADNICNKYIIQLSQLNVVQTL
jgi:hypothetical protein